MTATSSALAPYLDRLGVAGRPPATLETLVDLHRRHLAAVPYENLGIMLGRPPAVDPAASLARIGETGRAGYCFHQNGALETALHELGFEVSRRHGHVWTADEHRSGTDLNHLVLVVTGLPTADNPGGRWWPDVGLGEGVGDPLPLVAGTYGGDPLTVTIETVDEDGWSYLHHGVRLLPRDRGAQPAHRRGGRAVRAHHAVDPTGRAVHRGAGRAAPGRRVRRHAAGLRPVPGRPGRAHRDRRDGVRRLAGGADATPSGCRSTTFRRTSCAVSGGGCWPRTRSGTRPGRR